MQIITFSCLESWYNPLHRAQRYALRFLPQILLAAGQTSNLFSLARDENFLSAQENAFPSEPDIALQTLAAARDAADLAGLASLVAEFQLTYSDRIEMLLIESPVRCWKRTNDFERSWWLVSHQDGWKSVLTALNFLGVLHRTGHLDKCRIGLQKLAENPSLRLIPPAWQDCARRLLGNLSDVDINAMSTLRECCGGDSLLLND
jgi:hypothetical protein